MKTGFVLNPIEEYVNTIRRRVRDHGGYCLYAEKGDKRNKCPKYCKTLPDCPCGMYIEDSTTQKL